MTLKQLFPKSSYPLRARTRVQIKFNGKRRTVIQEVYYQTPILTESDSHFLLQQHWGLYRIIREGKKPRLAFAAVGTEKKLRFYYTTGGKQFIELSDEKLTTILKRHAELIGHHEIGLPLSGELLIRARWKSF
ncbi:MAG: hypothetical protein HYT98_02860 [Candidatus Sungbacteria bacterium]|nr:hypothetical protein [Candidatus Sungbacteria bacterium]